MKILIAAVAQSKHLSGITRHAVNVARCLLTTSDISAIYMVVADWQYDSIRALVTDTDPRLHIHPVSFPNTLKGRTLWYWRDLPLLSAELKADIVHVGTPTMVKSRNPQCPTVVTLHDLYPFDIPANFGSPLKILFNRTVLKQCLRAVDAIACVSGSTALRLGSYVSKSVQEKAVTVYNCVEPGPPMSVKGPLPDGVPFVLCVAQHRHNKNVVLSMEIFQRLLAEKVISSETRLLIVGIEGPETPLIHNFIRESGLGDQIVLVRGIDDAELQWCYGHSQFLLAPSIVEGFGLPIVEAMMQHSRIVCSDIPAFREVGGDYCQYASLNPPAVPAFVEATRKALNSAPPPPSGLDRFSGERVGEAYVKLYRRLLNGALAEPQLEETTASAAGQARG